MRIAVLGGGNGSFAAAGDLALAGHEVRLWRRDRAAVEAHRAAGGAIVVKDFRGRHEAHPALITADIAEAVRGASLILCPTPATAQADIAKALAPHLADGQVVFLPPGTFGSVVFAQAARDAGNRADVAFAETGTLPWLTRKHGPFEVAITIRAKRLPTGVFPARLAEPCARGDRARLSRRHRAVRRRALGRPDERRPHHPSAADRHERRAARAFRALGHPQGGHASRRAPRHRCARRRAHRHPGGAGLRRAAFSARQPLRARGRGVDVRPRLARQAHRLRRLAREDRADRAPLHAGGRAHRPFLPRLGRRARRRCDAARRRVPRHRLGHLRRGFHARPAARCRAWASATSIGPGCSACCTKASGDRARRHRLSRRRPHGARPRRRVRLCRPSRRDRRPQGRAAQPISHAWPRTPSPRCAARSARSPRSACSRPPPSTASPRG